MIEQEPQLLVGRIGNERFQMATFASYTAAVDAHTKLSSALRRGLVAIPAGKSGYLNVPAVRFVGGPTSMDYLAVRAASDPQWNRAPKLRLIQIDEGSKGNQSLRSTLTRLVKQLGLSIHGHEGGWLYTGGPKRRHFAGEAGCKITSHQGWMSWWYWASPRYPEAIVYSAGRYYLTVQPKPIVTASVALVAGA